MLKSHDLHTVTENGLEYFLTPKGKKFASVTTILRVISQFRGLTFSGWKAQRKLENWKSKVGEEVAEQVWQDACDRGTDIHQRIANYLRGGRGTRWPKNLLPFGYSVKSFLLQIEEVKLVESTVFHPVLQYAGKVDAVARWQGNLSLIEWKTANYPQKREWIQGYLLQSAAYLGAANKTFNLGLRQSLIVIAVPGRDAQIFSMSWEELETYFLKWLTYVKLFWALQKSIDIQTGEQLKLITAINSDGSIKRFLSR